jgi:glycosyltransferase involved in cell wall biosynthesis
MEDQNTDCPVGAYGFGVSHISVCICTYKRPQLLDNLLNKLQGQRTEGLFTYSLVIADNDREYSAKSTVSAYQNTGSVLIEYCVEAEVSIALARNKAIQNAKGEFFAFIDDDEFPENNWLLKLYKTCQEYKAGAVLGPVIPHYEGTPPKWLVRGRFCERPSYETGTWIHWSKCRLGNVLVRASCFQHGTQAFNPKFRFQGEDVALFKGLDERGYSFVWCKDAPVYEAVTESRYRKAYFLRRAFVQGNVSLQYYEERDWRETIHILLKSVAASMAYTTMLPFCLLAGTHIFMRYLIKDVHHISRLLALFHLVSMNERGF